jgi:NAD-dependent DNA ligase
MSREMLEDELRARGAKIVKTVTKKTDLVIAGKNPSQAKLNTAAELNIPIIYIGGDK